MATHVQSGAGGGDRHGGGGASYPGQRLGYPEDGRGSIATTGRRVAALAVDWGFSLLIAIGLLGFRLGQAGGSLESFKPLAVFLVMNVLLVGTWGSTIGHKLLGLQVQRINGGYAGLVPAVIRSVLLCLAVPPLIWDNDLRGLHDRAAGTVLRRTG